MYQPTAPKTSIAEDGSLKYDEFNRSSKNMKEYVEELRAGSELTLRHEVQFSEKLGELESLLNGLSAESFSAAANNVNSKEQLDAVFASLRSTLPAKGARMPFVFLKSRKGADLLHWDYDEDLTSTYLSILSQIASAGISFKGKNVLVTGAGRGSIGIELVQMLLSGGARVIVTTARFSRAGTEFYRQVYEKHGAKGSRLVVVPFNGCSAQDTKALINYIYDKDLKKGLGWDLDIVIPFAAFPQGGREIDGIDSKSELAFRLMLTNVFRLMGEIKLKKQLFGYDTRPASVLLPLSPNHGTFGGDGLYSESKIALETLMNRFVSENWGSYLTIIGAVIG